MDRVTWSAHHTIHVPSELQKNITAATWSVETQVGIPNATLRSISRSSRTHLHIPRKPEGNAPRMARIQGTETSKLNDTSTDAVSADKMKEIARILQEEFISKSTKPRLCFTNAGQ
jgi:hypothetical protein